jgi:hypothetical protein
MFACDNEWQMQASHVEQFFCMRAESAMAPGGTFSDRIFSDWNNFSILPSHVPD